MDWAELTAEGEAETNPQALFSLQVHVDQVTYQPIGGGPAPSTTSRSEHLLAFQLLQYDIVLFDDGTLTTATATAEVSKPTANEPLTVATAATPLGQSCLFECDPQRLALQIRNDEQASFVLLVLRRESHKAQLVAFACVGLELPHLAFSSARGGHGQQPRVSEWVSVEDTWPLRNHQNQEVGRVAGSITLSCLGHALAPHLATHAFSGAMQVLTTHRDTSSVSSGAPTTPRRRDGEDDSDQVAPNDAKATKSPVKQDHGSAACSPTKKTKADQVREAAVQCDDPWNEDNDAGGGSHGLLRPKPILIERGKERNTTDHHSPRRRIVDELDRVHMQSPTTHGSDRRHIRISSHDEDRRGHRQQPNRRRQEQAGPFLLQPPELPPPLFFHKPKQPPSHGKRRT